MTTDFIQKIEAALTESDDPGVRFAIIQRYTFQYLEHVLANHGRRVEGKPADALVVASLSILHRGRVLGIAMTFNADKSGDMSVLDINPK